MPGSHSCGSSDCIAAGERQSHWGSVSAGIEIVSGRRRIRFLGPTSPHDDSHSLEGGFSLGWGDPER